MKKTLLIILAVTFVVCVFNYGTNKRFSLEKWIENIVVAFDGVPTVEGLTNIWKDSPTINRPTYPDDFIGPIPPDDLVDGEETFWDKCVDFFKGIGDFFGNLWESIIYVVNMVISVFDIIYALVPWNSSVGV